MCKFNLKGYNYHEHCSIVFLQMLLKVVPKVCLLLQVWFIRAGRYTGIVSNL